MPTMRGTVDRRVLITFTIDPEVARSVLPAPLRPDLSMGPAFGGICLIRVRGLRPAVVPARCAPRLDFEYIVHRIAVEWDTSDGVSTGVYVLRRDTDCGLLTAAGRLVPGTPRRAEVGIAEDGRRVDIAAQSRDGRMSVAFVGEEAGELPATSVFTGPDSASAFFRCDRVALADDRRHGAFAGIRMESELWHGTPMRCEYAQSSLFEDRAVFPAGSVVLDHALVVRDLPARWVALRRIDMTRPALAEVQPAAAAGRRC